MIFTIFIALLILLRIIELIYSNRNEVWLRSNGAVEYGQHHYPFIILLHSAFIVSLLFEYYLRGCASDFSAVLLSVYVMLMLAKLWVIASLGKYWSTKILRIPGTPPVRRGLYRIVQHPNYIIVVGEIAVIPLIFHLYVTAIVFSILNAIMLTVRINEENRVWRM